MRSKLKKLFVATSAASMAMGINTSVFAQEEDAPFLMEEIIITALKRGDQNALDAPAGVSSIGGDQIADLGADGLDDFLQLAAGTSIDRNFGAGSTSIQIRGVNTTFGSATVGFYLDDLSVSFINLNFLPDPSPFDLERVEVLKGPQGALYGSGSAGGVVILKTQKPILDELSGKYDVSGSDTSGGDTSYSGSGLINVPLLDDLAALRTSVSYQDNGGWIDDNASGADDINREERLNSSVKLLVVPVDNLSINLSATFSRLDNDFGGDVADDSGNYPETTALFAGGSFDSSSETDYDQYGAVVDYDFDSFSVKNALGMIELDTVTDQLGNRKVQTILNLKTVVNEFRVNSTHGGPVSWLAGVYYRKSEQDLFQDIFGLPNLDDEASSEQHSIFGELTYSFLDGGLDVSVGGSYFDDSTKNVTDTSILGPFAAFALPETEVSTYKFSPMASVAFYPTESSTIYARYAKGFRAAITDFGLSLAFVRSADITITGELEPEDITSYEIGAKSEFADGLLYTEVALFLNETEDIQQSSDVDVPFLGGATINTLLNTGDARSYGAEWLFKINPTDGLNLIFSGAYVDTELLDDTPARVGSGLDFEKGTRLNLVPELLFNSLTTYSWALGDLDATALINIQYSSDRSIALLGEDPIEGDEVVRTDLRFELAKDNKSVYVFVDNVADEDGVIAPTRQTSNIENSAGALTDGITGTRFRPRTIGLGFRGTF